MTYSVKAQISLFSSIEVFVDNIEIVVQLLNNVTRKFFSKLSSMKVQIAFHLEQ